MPKNIIRIATRGSALALWQANFVKNTLLQAHPDLTIELIPITTSGDKILSTPLYKIGGKGLFVKELEVAILENRADIAVHSIKDLPGECPDGLEISTICEREDPRDAFLSTQYHQLKDLPKGSIVGTTSLRRSVQLLIQNPDVIVKPLRGNVDSRVKKLIEQEYDAIILAAAGLKRLGLENHIKEYLTTDDFLPAAGQGAVGIECRSDDHQLKKLLSMLDHNPTRICITAERSMNAVLNAGCQVPVAAYATLNADDTITLKGLVADPEGKIILREEATDIISNAKQLGIQVAQQLINQGAAEILKNITHHTDNFL